MAVRAMEENPSAEAEAAKQQEAEGAVAGEASVAKVDEATMAKVDEAEAVKADERTAPTEIGKAAAEAALMSPRIEDQPRGHSKEREVHTISSNEPPNHT
jgi:hypothetical protein